MTIYRCRSCGSDIRTDAAENWKEYKEVFLENPCDFCKLITKEWDAEEKLLEAVFGGSK
tara:strand:+ start:96 stop:272 length:177 start_codon:yes stop_codon:yes gene_type:complete